MLIAVNQAGLPFAGSRCDQSVYERQPLRHRAADIERRESHSFVDGNDLVQQLQVILHGAASLFGRGPELTQAPGKLGERDTGGQDLGLVVLKQCLDAGPPGLFAAMSEQGRSVEQEAQRR